MTCLNPFNLLPNFDRIPRGCGFKYDIPIRPFDFRDTSGLSLTGSGNQQIAVGTGVPSVLLSASTAAAVMLSLPVPGRYDASQKRQSTVDRFADGDLFELSLVLGSSVSTNRKLTASFKNTRQASLTSFTAVSDVVKTIAGTSKTLYTWSFSGSKVLPRDLVAITLTAENTLGDLSIYGGFMVIRSNLVNYETSAR